MKYNNLSKFKNDGQTSAISTPKKVNDTFCDYCNSNGHTRDKCFCLHGYPDWHKLYGNPKPNPRKNQGIPNAKSAAQVSTNHPVTSGSTDVKNESCGKDSMLFTDAQCQQLAKMIQDTIRQTNNWSAPSTSQMSGNPFYSCSIVSVNLVLSLDYAQYHTWILDSGATNHITCHQSILHDLEPLKAELYLPDGNTVSITHSGTIQLTKDISLFDVLCVPDFTCNLISVAKLLSNPSIALVFSTNTCVLQDHTLKKESEIGNLQDGLYKFHVPYLFRSQSQNCISNCKSALNSTMFSSSRCNSVTESHAQLWHSRLGHPSTVIPNKIHVIPKHSLTFQECDICHYSKQHRLPFTVSDSHSTGLFDLIHLDVWGPYKQPTHNNF